MKYLANVGAWRLVLRHGPGYQVIDGRRGTASVSEVHLLDQWDAHHWRLHCPALVGRATWAEMPPPTHLAGAVNHEILVLPFKRAQQGLALFSAAARDEALSDLDKKFIRMFGQQFSDHVNQLLLSRQAMQVLREQATHDALTGALNRGAIMEILDMQLAQARRSGQSLCVLMGDVDRFKSINDNFGHPVGDQVLRELVRRFRLVARKGDNFGRYGGEEILIVLYPCTSTNAVLAPSASRLSLANTAFALDGELSLPVTMSFGLAGTDTDAQPSADSLIKRADDALYQSKAQGRNRVTVAPRVDSRS